MKLDKMSIEFHCGLDFRLAMETGVRLLGAVKICLFFHVNTYGCNENTLQ